VVIIYGGAWIFGSRAQSAELARTLAHLGYTAVAIDYRHAPAYRFPSQLDDVRDALATIARNANDWGIDARRVAIYGSSAGAELALLAAYEPSALNIRAAIAYYAPTDLIDGYRQPPRPDPAHVQRILDAYLGGPPDQWPGNYLASSPIDAVRPGLPPTLLVIGGRDELVRPGFAFAMRDKLRGAGDRAGALLLPWSNHAFDSIPNGTGGQVARYYTERFIAQTL
jgi:acetyl esterase/lipase